MADINLTINILNGDQCPTLTFIDTTDLSIVINGGSPILSNNSIIEPIPQDTTVTIVVEKTGFDTYTNSIDVGSIDQTLFISLTETVPVDFIHITEACHSYTISNNATTSDDNVTYTITNLDNVVIDDNLNIELNFGTSKTFAPTTDGVYLVIVKDIEDAIIRQYVILDICSILTCITNRILAILCPSCGCQSNDCQDLCKKDYDMKRINLLGFDLLNRINREYRLNSYYTTIDQAKINELKTAQEVIDKLNIYCSSCGSDSNVNFATLLNNTPSNSDCGCS